MSRKRDWKVVLAGECMMSRPFSAYEEPKFRAVLDLLADSDVTYAHLEMNFGTADDLEWAARGDWIASYMIAEPDLAAELKAVGIDLLSLAHNHSFDFGPSGLLATARHCRAAGFACAGTGRDLEEAREPAFLETRKGRVALVSTSSGNKAYEWASHPKAQLRGRPGVNPLRVSMKYEIDRAAAAELERLAGRLGIGGRREAGEIVLNFPGDQSTRTAPAFVAGEGFGVFSECHPRDLEGNLRSIGEAAAMADLVMVAHHFNVSEGPRSDNPPRFARQFAHAAIEAGADICIGHGWHKTLGIEIHDGKPIFYGVGNFICQSEFVRRVPYDSYEAWDHDVDRLTTLNAAAHPLHPGLDLAPWWSSAVFELAYDGDVLKEIRLHPVEMGRRTTPDGTVITRRTGKGSHALTEGRPFLADGETGEAVLRRLKSLSEPFGTRIDIEKGIGVIRL
ncbi:MULTISPECIES: CapA family protein [unclassified Shinella]|uniref:CapA family protein n=2 Tax=Shinella TaxID=323620 RepID=UPI00225CD438|nr:CapA family protein [Shinella sp. YE25]MDC7258839.1 CapA family protein [Shinella sp. YE25]CAI0334385.1 Capsule biosynthesis protein [Rhizobiaceae bacterium]CAK7260567.1 Capsule biosynthesis protein [Shinella sp. WSC3-e]